MEAIVTPLSGTPRTTCTYTCFASGSRIAERPHASDACVKRCASSQTNGTGVWALRRGASGAPILLLSLPLLGVARLLPADGVVPSETRRRRVRRLL